MGSYKNSNWLGVLILGIFLIVFGAFANAFIYSLLWDHAVVPVCASIGYILPDIKFAHFVVISSVIACLHTKTNKDNETMELSEAWVKFMSIICSKILMVLIAMLLVKMLL